MKSMLFAATILGLSLPYSFLLSFEMLLLGGGRASFGLDHALISPACSFERRIVYLSLGYCQRSKTHWLSHVLADADFA